MEWLRDWWPVIAGTFGLALAAATWAVRKGLASREDLARFERDAAKALSNAEKEWGEAMKLVAHEVQSQADRVLKLEGEVRHLPTVADINEVKSRQAEMSGTLTAIQGQQQAQGLALARIENFLLNGKNR